MNVLITGASGFVGSGVLTELLAHPGFMPRAALRQGNVSFPSGVDVVQVGNLASATDWSAALQNIDAVIHSAARAHIMNEPAADSLTEFRQVNVEGTLNLAREAASAGVKRFVFISSIKVNGEETQPDSSFRECDPCNPQDPYGVSKHEAEQGLRKIADATGMEVAIIRPPLIYGPGVKGNFASLIGLLKKSLPLPLGAVNNKRSLIGIDNLVDFIVTCVEHSAAANQTFLVSDGEDLSTTDLLIRLANAMGKSSRLIPIPTSILELGAQLLGKQAVAQRLLGSLQVDISKAKDLLGWEPPVSVDEGLKRCVVDMSHEESRDESQMIRLFDIFFSVFGLFFGFPLLFLLTVIGLIDTGSPIFCQERVGKGKKPFVLVKFRTMKLDTVSVASHLASASSITKFGHFLRRSKLDELPQLWNVLKGEMSLVGPRPCLFNQEELIQEREIRGVLNVRPGITGLAQINDIDMSTPELLAETDARMIQEMSLKNYFTFILRTVTGKGSGDRVRK